MARAGASTSSSTSPGPAPAACSAQCYPGLVPPNILVTESAKWSGSSEALCRMMSASRYSRDTEPMVERTLTT